jgi:hypothetical protein
MDNFILLMEKIPYIVTMENRENFTYFYIPGKLPMKLNIGDLICINRQMYHIVAQELDGSTVILKCREDK